MWPFPTFRDKPAPRGQAQAIAESMARAAKRVIVIEDSTHEKHVVLANIKVLSLSALDSSPMKEAPSALLACVKCSQVDFEFRYNNRTTLLRFILQAYGRFVSPGSYMVVQDTRCGRWKPADAIEDFLSLPEVHSQAQCLLPTNLTLCDISPQRARILNATRDGSIWFFLSIAVVFCVNPGGLWIRDEHPRTKHHKDPARDPTS